MADVSSGPSSAPVRIRWISIAAAVASITAVGIALGLGLPLLSVILEKRGISSSLIGLNSAMAGLASMAAAPLTAPLARRFGVAPTMLAAIILSAATAIAFYYAEDFLLWFPLRVAFHGAITVLFILSEFWINDAAPPHRRGLVLGIYATVLSLGFAGGPWIFAKLGSDGPLPFVVGAAIILLAAIPILAARNETPQMDVPAEQNFWRYLFVVPTATAAVFVFGAVESGGLALFPVYSARIGFSEADGALLLSMIGLGNVVFQIPIGLVADRISDKRRLLFVFAVIGLIGALALPALGKSWWLTGGVLLIWGGCVAGLYTVGLTHLGAKLSGFELASANAAFIFCYSLGMLAGPQTIGVMMDVSGTDGFGYALASFFGLYLALTLVRIATRPKRP